MYIGSSWKMALMKLQKKTTKPTTTTEQTVIRRLQRKPSQIGKPLPKHRPPSKIMDQWREIARHRREDQDEKPQASMEEACREALKLDLTKRQPQDLLTIQTWLQHTKLKDWLDLDKVPLDTLDRVTKAMTIEPYYCGEMICRQGEVGSVMFIVFSGTLEVRVEGGIHEERGLWVAELGTGELVGQMSLVENVPRNASVHTLTFSELVCVSQEALEPLLPFVRHEGAHLIDSTGFVHSDTSNTESNSKQNHLNQKEEEVRGETNGFLN